MYLIIFFNQVIDEEWESWEFEHNKVYKNEHEEKFRLKIFMENKHQIAQHNILYHQQKRNYSLTMNQFGDLLQHEFSGKYSSSNDSKYHA